MKKSLLIIITLFIAVLSNAQSDVVFPIKGEPIRDCEITEVRNGNLVFYIKDFHTESINAKAINRNGTHTELSRYRSDQYNSNTSPNNGSQSGLNKGHGYDYYSNLYKKAKGRSSGGKFLTLFGLGGTIAGGVLLYSDDSVDSETGAIIYLAGAVMFNIGIPLWISGGVKANNNKRAMEMSRSATQLSLGTSGNGIGLVFNF